MMERMKKLKEKPLSFHVGWTVIAIMGINKAFFPEQFLYSKDLSFLTSNFSGLIIYTFLLLSALDVIKYDFKK